MAFFIERDSNPEARAEDGGWRAGLSEGGVARRGEEGWEEPHVVGNVR